MEKMIQEPKVCHSAFENLQLSSKVLTWPVSVYSAYSHTYAATWQHTLSESAHNTVKGHLCTHIFMHKPVCGYGCILTGWIFGSCEWQFWSTCLGLGGGTFYLSMPGSALLMHIFPSPFSQPHMHTHTQNRQFVFLSSPLNSTLLLLCLTLFAFCILPHTHTHTLMQRGSAVSSISIEKRLDRCRKKPCCKP